VGSIWTKVVPSARAAEWFVRVALPFGRWLVVGEVIVNVGGYALVVTLTSIVGASDVGGLRAAETIFAPFSLLAMALSLPGLPAMSRALARGRGEAIRLAWTISVSGVLVTLAYLAVVLVAGTWVLTALFGASFEEYGSLIVPMSLWQLLLTIQVGFTILLRAQLRGSALALASASTVGVTLACATMLATAWGIGGAVWGMCVGVGVGCAVVIGLSIRSPSSAEADDGPLSRGLRADDIALRPGSTLGS
jgi:O-antigen/teichoic acid export membrane protein